MDNFDKNKVLERILEEAPTLSNLRGEIIVTDPVFDKLEKRVIYAFYGNRGIPDPDLHYHRKANPHPTTPNSTLCEIYSFWEGDPNVQELLKSLHENPDKLNSLRQHMKEIGLKDSTIHQGPWVENSGELWDDDPMRARMGEEYNFLHSTCAFSRHFNKICEEFRFEPRLISIKNSKGYLAIQIPAQASLNIDGRITQHDIGVKMPIGINFYRKDPTLSGALDTISNTYEKLKRGEFARVDLCLYGD